MKKTMLIFLLALLLLPGAAAGELGDRLTVAGGEGFAALLESPGGSAAASALIPGGEAVIALDAAQGGYVWAVYEGKRGYIREDALKGDAAAQLSALTLTAQERLGVNTFLTAFSRQGFAFASAYDEAQRTDRQMTDFALGYIFLCLPQKVARGDEQGNLRIAAEEMIAVSQQFFGHAPVHLTDSEFPYLGGDYFMNGFLLSANSGFACADKVCPLGGGRYAVSFHVYGCGAAWTTAMCAFTPEQAKAAYGDTRVREGFAILKTGEGGLAAAQDFVLERWAVR